MPPKRPLPPPPSKGVDIVLENRKSPQASGPNAPAASNRTPPPSSPTSDRTGSESVDSLDLVSAPKRGKIIHDSPEVEQGQRKKDGTTESAMEKEKKRFNFIIL